MSDVEDVEESIVDLVGNMSDVEDVEESINDLDDYLNDASSSGGDTPFNFNSSDSSIKAGTVVDGEGGKRAERAILCSKALFIFVLLAAPAALSISVYVVLRNQEADDFATQVRIGSEVEPHDHPFPLPIYEFFKNFFLF
jgi:hypothetical protein